MLQSEARIERREFKYLIDSDVVAAVRRAISPFCELDPFSGRAPEHRYTIESLYFDAPSLPLFQANEQELLDRYKLRVRHYPDQPDGPVFFEVKRRYHDVIVKSRGKVGRDWAELLDDPWIARERVAWNPAVERYVALTQALQAEPISLVRYRREAWTSTIDDYARITFDSVIESQPARGLSFDHDPRGWRAADDACTQGTTGSMTVLELKFTRQVPSWLVAIVQRLNLSRRSFSKYGTSILTWRIPPMARKEAI